MHPPPSITSLQKKDKSWLFAVILLYRQREVRKKRRWRERHLIVTREAPCPHLRYARHLFLRYSGTQRCCPHCGISCNASCSALQRSFSTYPIPPGPQTEKRTLLREWMRYYGIFVLLLFSIYIFLGKNSCDRRKSVTDRTLVFVLYIVASLWLLSLDIFLNF